MPQPFTKCSWNFAWNEKQIWRIINFMPAQWILDPFKSQKFHLSWRNAWFQSSFFGTKDTRGLRNSPSSPSASLEENQVFNYFSLGKFLFKDVLTLAWRWFPGTTPWEGALTLGIMNIALAALNHHKHSAFGYEIFGGKNPNLSRTSQRDFPGRGFSLWGAQGQRFFLSLC